MSNQEGGSKCSVATANPVNRVWFANVVVGTQYVGPINMSRSPSADADR